MALFWNVLAIRAAAIGKSGNRPPILTLGGPQATVKSLAPRRYHLTTAFGKLEVDLLRRRSGGCGKGEPRLVETFIARIERR